MSKTRHDELRERVNAFHREHPDVWRQFEELSLEAVRRGFKHYAAATIFELLRWRTPLGADGKEQFKLNCNYVAFYARRFMRLHPEHADFFRTRKQKSKEVPARNLRELAPADFE